MKEINARVRNAAVDGSIVPGFNVFGHEDALAFVEAAERARTPVLLMVNHDARMGMDIAHWGALLASIASQASVPVGIHLDHCTDKDLIVRAMQHGFTSVMYDGSKLPLAENIANTREIVQLAHALDLAVEGEVGTVPYDDKGEKLVEMTSPMEAGRLSRESGLDWLAVSVGNVHRLTDRKVPVDFQTLQVIESACDVPLVVHGASGLFEEDIQRLKQTRVAKLNFGTVFRYIIGQTLREEINLHPDEFDRLRLMKRPARLAGEKAYEILISLKREERNLNP